jgi:hypothetical protein
MFSISNKKNDAANVVREKAIEPRTERPLAFRIEQLEERIAPAAKYFDKASPILM